MMTNEYVIKNYPNYNINDYLKDNPELQKAVIEELLIEVTKLEQTLQEIKAIAKENKDTVQYGGICRSILMELTKAEEE